MSGFAAGETPAGTDEFTADEEVAVDELTRAPKAVFSATLDEPLTSANTALVGATTRWQWSGPWNGTARG